MTTALITISVVLANVLGAGMAYPQAARLVRTGRTDGVSGVWAGVSTSMNLWWLAYGVTAGLWGLVPVSVVAAALYVVIVGALVRAHGRAVLGPVALGALGLGLVPLPFLLLGGWALAGIAVGLCYGLQLVPAVVAACRTRDLSGVAAATWLMAWTESAIWLAYGWSRVDAALVAGGIAGTSMATIIIVRLAATGHRPFELRRPALRTT